VVDPSKKLIPQHRRGNGGKGLGPGGKTGEITQTPMAVVSAANEMRISSSQVRGKKKGDSRKDQLLSMGVREVTKHRTIQLGGRHTPC